MIAPIRESAGLGNPPQHFTTNSNESMNKALHYEERNWDKFCDEMLALVKIRYQETEKSVLRTGKYRFQSQFTYLEVPFSKWNNMSVKQREKHMKRVMRATMHSSHMEDIINKCDDQNVDGYSDAHHLDALPNPPNIPHETWNRAVAKANAIAVDLSSMSTVPGGNGQSKFVAWFRNPDSPIKVQAGKYAGPYTCSKTKCPMFAGYKICAHVLAVAKHNGDTETLIEKYCRSAKEPNLTDVAMMGMPKNAGKKPRSENPRLRKAKQKASVGQLSENLVPSSSTVSARNQPLTSMQYDTQTAANQHPLLSCFAGPLQPQPQITPSLAYCPPPLLSQATNQFTGPLQPKPLVANTPPVPPPPPLIHSAGTPIANININQQPSSCSHTSLTVNQPCFSSESTPSSYRNYNHNPADPNH